MSTLNAFQQQSLRNQGRVAGKTIGERREIEQHKQGAHVAKAATVQSKTVDRFSGDDKAVADGHRAGNAYQGTAIRYTHESNAPAYRHQRVQNIHSGTDGLLRAGSERPTREQCLSFLDAVIGRPELHTQNSVRKNADRIAGTASRTAATRKAPAATNAKASVANIRSGAPRRA